MAIFTKSLVVVLLIVVLAVTKLLLDYLFPGSAVYHDLLVFNYQLFLLVWLALFILIKLVYRKPFKITRLTLPLVAFFLILDGVFFAMISRPASIPAFCLQTFKNYYTGYHRNVLQYEPYSQYDTALFYSFKPNTSFSFANVEFANGYKTNKLSLRDDDSSATQANIICLGDSYSLGWGVNQNESFPYLLKSLTGKKVLNASMSSFGTARELKQLAMLDTSALQYIVIQYCLNDADENQAFNQLGFLPISSEQSYQQQVQTYQWQRRYFPGKFSITIIYNYLKSALRNSIKGNSIPYYLSLDPRTSAKEFLRVMNAYSPFFENRKVILVDLNDFNELNSQFITSVQQLLDTPDFSNIRNSIITINVTNTLSREDFYILDAHIKPSGHRKIAALISQHIQ